VLLTTTHTSLSISLSSLSLSLSRSLAPSLGQRYRIAKIPDLDLTKPTTHSLDDGKFVVTVVDSVADYLDLMKELFDFPAIKSHVAKVHGPRALLVQPIACI
jgi:phosphoglucomutase